MPGSGSVERRALVGDYARVRAQRAGNSLVAGAVREQVTRNCAHLFATGSVSRGRLLVEDGGQLLALRTNRLRRHFGGNGRRWLECKFGGAQLNVVLSVSQSAWRGGVWWAWNAASGEKVISPRLLPRCQTCQYDDVTDSVKAELLISRLRPQRSSKAESHQVAVKERTNHERPRALGIGFSIHHSLSAIRRVLCLIAPI